MATHVISVVLVAYFLTFYLAKKYVVPLALAYIIGVVVGGIFSFILAFVVYPSMGLITMGEGNNNAYLLRLFIQGFFLSLLMAGFGLYSGKKRR